MPFKKNNRACDTTSKNDTRMFPPSDLKKLGVCINDAASASTSNKSALLTKMERRQNNVRNNNKRDSASISLDRRDESYVHKDMLLHAQSSFKDFIDIEIDNRRSDSIERRINVGRENVAGKNEADLDRNEVPKSCKIMQSAARKTELITEYHDGRTNIDCRSKTLSSRKKLLSSVKCDKPGTSAETRDTDVLATSRDDVTSIVRDLRRKDNVHLINSKNVPDKNISDFQRDEMSDHIVSNNFSQLTRDNILENQEPKEIENGVTALPAKPTRSLPLDLKASIEDNNEKKSRLVKVRNKLPSLTQSITEKMQAATAGNDPKSTEECTSFITRQQISYHEDTSIRKMISEAINENNDLNDLNNDLKNEVIHQDTCAENKISVKNDDQNQLPIILNKRKRGRPRKIVESFTDQSTLKKLKEDDVSREIPDIIAGSVTRDKRQASKSKITSISDLSDESDIVADEIFVRKRGRPPGSRGRRRGRGRGRGTTQNSLDAEYIPRLTMKGVPQLRTKESNKIDETSADVEHTANIKAKVQLVTCAKCDQEVLKKQWSSHNLYQHNNMAWKKDEEPLDFENDEKLLKKVLTSALKQKKKYLTCEKCKTTKRSVNGFISHMQFCGKSEQERQALMVTCPICNAVMMPSSMEVHERYHRQLEENKNKEANLQIEKTKRKAAEKAIPKILKLTESLKGKNLNTNNAIQMSKRKRIPSIWKVMWEKELASKDIASCKQVGCTFTCSSYETICEHYYECNFTPQEKFMCKICKFSADSKDEIVIHITETHSSNNDVEKHSDYEMEENENSSDENISEYIIKRKFVNRRFSKNSDSTKICPRMNFLDKETTQNPQSTELYKTTLYWTLDFELRNYELELFKDDVPNHFMLLSDNDAAPYLPELTISMAFKQNNVNVIPSKNTKNSDDDNWKRMNRFEGDACGDVPTFFVGGPVWALAWLPIPSPMYTQNPTQYIAISTSPTMESEYTVGKTYSGPNIIQIWDVGPLNNEVNSENRSPVLAYAITHNNGTVWCLEWCPSGCYQDVELGNYEIGESKLRRMGLLAAACSDGCINIYSLPFADELKFEKTQNNSWPIYKTEPVMTLLVNILAYDSNKQNWQCTRLSWTKEHGHSVIAAGFTNGYIGLWHLTTISPLLLTVRKNTKFIDAFQYFFAHYNAITMVALVPYGKNQFLASASLDQSYKFWNREEPDSPQSCLKKGIIVNGAWMTNWPCAVLSFDDAIGYQHTHTLLVPVREYGYKYYPILPTNSTTYGLAVSDHANGIAHGTLAGEVITIFPHQLLYPDKMLIKKRQLNSFIETVDFLEKQQHSQANESKDEKDSEDSEEYHYMPETYNECKDRFGVIFHDNLIDLQKNMARDRQKDTLNNEKLMSVHIEQYHFTSINRMAWNPNVWSYLWLTTGYQSGLVRLLNFSSMSESHDELRAHLPTHVNSMLAKKK